MSDRDTTADTDLAALWSRAWDAGQPPDLDAFLALHPGADSDEVVAILCLDQRRRWERGDRRTADAYLARRPDLAGDREAVLDLLYNEYVLLRESGESISHGD